jgi:transcription-repair coupling factor (superfamily II helicase)
VIHIDHGIGVLEDIERITAGEVGVGDTIRLGYAADVKLMAPATEIGRIWRYGSDSDALTLDKLNGGTWPARRAKVEAELAETADSLVALAREREATKIEPLVPPASEYERFASRFPFSETPDQARAIEAVLQDLASGKPADRLVCGDVGFGKTEVALRAAAAAALAGKQVAIVAPTTVLVRQHLRTVERRFAGLGITGRSSVPARQAGRGEGRQGRTRGRIHPGRRRHSRGCGQGRRLQGPRPARHR